MEKNKIDEIVLQQTAISSVKFLISNLPIIGSVLNEFLFNLNGRIKQERINKMVMVLEKKLQDISEEKINKEYLKSEDFYDLTLKVFETAAKSKEDIKRKFLANLYIDAIQKEIKDDSFLFIFNDFILVMKLEHIKILSFIDKNIDALKEIGSFSSFYDKFTENEETTPMDKYEFQFFVTDLETKSIISTGGGLTKFDDKSVHLVVSESKVASVTITSIGKRFIQYLCE